MSDLNFAGKNILVVGGGTADGIGYATAKKCALAGAQVALADLKLESVEPLVRELPGSGAHTAHSVNVTDEASVAAMVKAVIDQHGHIDGVLIAAGVHSPATFLDTPLDVWNKMFAVNTTGTFLVAQAVGRHMAGRKQGRIVALSSVSGRIATASGAAYGASKAAVIHLARYMALDLAKHQVTVNVICPGSTSTSMMGTDPVRHDAAINGSLEQWRLGIPLGHMAEAGDQAAAIAFLLSDEAKHITGQILHVDGGQALV